MATALKTISDACSGIVSRIAPGVVTIQSARSRSSGFVWRPGLVVGADERVADEGEISVVLPGGATVEAKVAGRDPGTDIAVLRIPREDIGPVGLAAARPGVGALVVAVGGRMGSVSAALGMIALSDGPWRSMRGGEIDARIELDLDLGRGGEGGLAVDADGGAIGMIVKGPRRSVLVIPAATIERVAAQLAEKGRIPRGYLGLGLHLVTLPGGGSGAMVMNVDPSGPGVAAGIHQGDVLVAWDGRPVDRLRELVRSLGPDSVGRTVAFDVRRGGSLHRIPLQIAERPAS